MLATIMTRIVFVNEESFLAALAAATAEWF
jgi:hypothetical protein